MKKAAEAIRTTDNLQDLARAAGTTPKTLELFAAGKRKITEHQKEAIHGEMMRQEILGK